MSKLLFTGSEWSIALIEKMWSAIEKLARNMGFDPYPPQIEIITSEQMLDCYSTVALPIYYSHWSFGKTFLQNERAYQKGMQGLAYEVVINTNPCIAYLMENNTACIQALVLAHASCVDGDTECLTDAGWIKISEYNGQKIAQYDNEGNIRFISPIRYIQTTTDKFYDIRARGVNQRVTPDHKMVFKIKDKLIEQSAEEFLTQHRNKTRGHLGKFISHFKYSGKGIEFTEDELRLAVAIKADGSFHAKVDSDHFNCVNHQRVRFHLKKERKITRLCTLLGRMNIEYVIKETYGGRVKVVFNVPLNKYSKRYESEWYAANANQLKIIGEEVLYWDGHYEGNSFSSINKSDADYIQFVWASLGYGTSIYKYVTKGKQDCYNVTKGNFAERSISRSRGGIPNEIVETSGGTAYCFTTDTGMWLARREDNIFVTGNCGHSHFFKNNYLFKGWTDADTIIDYLKFAKNYIKNCEEKHGAKRIERLLDACHSLQAHGVDKYKKPARLSDELAHQRQKQREEYSEKMFNDMWRTIPKKSTTIPKPGTSEFPEENLLYFIEKNSPILESWEREIVRIVRKISQYFYPQRQTQLLNEGFATFSHHLLMTEMHDRGMIDDGSYLEFLECHTNVVAQRDWDSKHYSGINVYALGFAMLTDIRRICESPDSEDHKWFPDIAGNGKGLETILHIVENYRDESFVMQFLSPKVARAFKLFSFHISEGKDYLQVNATHDDDDFLQLRAALAASYDLSRSIPSIEVVHVDWTGDRTLYIEHRTKNNCRLHYADAKRTVEHLNTLWGFTVDLEYRDLDGNQLENV
jgi:spore cortex formation protein SpoVR/YcgB (stage V sporulation)